MKKIFIGIFLIAALFVINAENNISINLFASNIEALAQEDPPPPPPGSNFDNYGGWLGWQGGNGQGPGGSQDGAAGDGEYYPGGGTTITCSRNAILWAWCYKFETLADSFSGRNCSFACIHTGLADDRCSPIWAVFASFCAYTAEY